MFWEVVLFDEAFVGGIKLILPLGGLLSLGGRAVGIAWDYFFKGHEEDAQEPVKLISAEYTMRIGKEMI